MYLQVKGWVAILTLWTWFHSISCAVAIFPSSLRAVLKEGRFCSWNFAKIFWTRHFPRKYSVRAKSCKQVRTCSGKELLVKTWRFVAIMGNAHGRRSSQQRKLRKRPHSIAVEKAERWSASSTPSQLQRSASQGSLRRRYTESGNYSYKTPWPVPLSEAVFLPEYDSKQPVKISDFEVCWQSWNIQKNSPLACEVWCLNGTVLGTFCFACTWQTVILHKICILMTLLFR